ncbi:MAG: hypothetical protein HY586_03630 [Candidatus Omnitrophica bacterium]|nr:hypothetical protein [Candidatus Omnitrophota bacterium]
MWITVQKFLFLSSLILCIMGHTSFVQAEDEGILEDPTEQAEVFEKTGETIPGVSTTNQIARPELDRD